MSTFTDPRQSPKWADSMEKLKWKAIVTSGGIYVFLFKTILGTLVKIQRPDNLTQQDLVEIEQICKKANALFIKISPNYTQDVSILENYGYIKSYFPLIPTKTMFIDLALSENDLWNKLSHSAKYSINRSIREGDHVDCIKNPDITKLKAYYQVAKETGKLKHFYVEPFKQLLSRQQSFGDDSYLILVYNKNGDLEGGKFCVVYKDTALYVTGGTSGAGRKTKSGYLLTWTAIKFFKSLGLKNFDLEGMDDDRFPSFTDTWGGFAHFKEKFGGEIVTYPHPYVKNTNKYFAFFSKVSPIGM
jgi:hypothetical protein